VTQQARENAHTAAVRRDSDRLLKRLGTIQNRMFSVGTPGLRGRTAQTRRRHFSRGR